MMKRGRHPVPKRQGIAPLMMCRDIIQFSPSVARVIREPQGKPARDVVAAVGRDLSSLPPESSRKPAGRDPGPIQFPHKSFKQVKL